VLVGIAVDYRKSPPATVASSMQGVLREVRRMRTATALLVVMVIAIGRAAAQEGEPVQDNSFLIEEAYNQDPGVVQHISMATVATTGSHDGVYTFTQEWPVGGLAHQLSYTLPWNRLDGSSGNGDMLVNYRYQLLGDSNAQVAIAPRVTLLLPTGDAAKGRGAGGGGLQLAFPVSIVLSPRWVIHLNGSYQRVLSARAPTLDGAVADTDALSAGQGLVFLATPDFNLMLEAVWARNETVTGPGRATSQDSVLLSPGIRWAYNLPGSLQIVPGIAVPFSVGYGGGGTPSLLLYLSFEHPFGRHSS
jgi:hypothetical protein